MARVVDLNTIVVTSFARTDGMKMNTIVRTDESIEHSFHLLFDFAVGFCALVITSGMGASFYSFLTVFPPVITIVKMVDLSGNFHNQSWRGTLLVFFVFGTCTLEKQLLPELLSFGVCF